MSPGKPNIPLLHFKRLTDGALAHRNLADVPAGTTIQGQYISLRFNGSLYTPRKSLLHILKAVIAHQAL